MSFCAYLRKSRADEVREKVEDGYDALAHHRAMLVELSERTGPIERWYSDGIKSGASLEHRDGMRALLADVRSGMWEGVLVVEVERLTRGDMIDQGTVLRAFAESSTLIVTPHKVYDPASEADESYLEFGLFMSRFEFKTINKRLIAGRVASVKEGQYIGQRAPWGYDKARIDGKHTLVPNDQRRYVVRLFEMFADGMSYRDMADSLQAMGARTVEGGRWNPSVIRKMVQNPVYIGKVSWNQTKQGVYYENGRKRYRTVRNSDALVVDGLHEPIISPELWERASQRIDAAPVRGHYQTRNPYGRILVCAECGVTLKWNAPSHPNGREVMKHPRKHSECAMKGCTLDVLNQAVAESLEEVACNLDALVESAGTGSAATAVDCRAEAERARKAIADNFDRMERGVISESDFVERRKVLEQRIADSIAEAERLESMEAGAVRERAVTIRDCIRSIKDPSMDAESKRKVVWSIIERIEYRNHGTVGHDELDLDIFLR